MKEKGQISQRREVCWGNYSNIMASGGGMGMFGIIRGACTSESPGDVAANDVLAMQSN